MPSIRVWLALIVAAPALTASELVSTVKVFALIWMAARVSPAGWTAATAPPAPGPGDQWTGGG